MTTRTDLAKQALEKSLEVREEHGYDFRSPLCVYELADRALDFAHEGRHLPEHFVMLAGETDHWLHVFASPRALQHDRGHFDGFRPGAENQEWTESGHGMS